ncbi:MAG: S8 family serine peptidase [Bacteroidetes bacterium]|nr:S8 family serine peptidase [Bacteroidota bacterium]
MKKHLLMALAGLMFFAACEKNEPVNPLQPKTEVVREDVLKEKANAAEAPQGEPFSKQETDRIIVGLLEEKGDFTWNMIDLKTLWSAAQYGDQTIALGYRPAGTGDLEKTIHQIDIKSAEWKNVHDALIQLIVRESSKAAGTAVKWEDILIEDDPVLPILTFRASSAELITRLYNLDNTRYIEPLDYWPETAERSSSGCDGSSYSLNSSDYTTISPAARMPWNYPLVNIPNAWNSTQGSDITIGVIDAGISSSQSLLNSNFTNGLSGSRTITTDYTYGSSAYTSCAHGTSMSGLAAGPRNNLNSSTGVAYRANLHFIRACDDVVLDKSSEKTAVKNALIRMGNRNDVKIISMSIGTPFSSGVLQDGVNYANNLGKLIFAAAGTSFSWTSWWGVIYPAKYSACVAVTGVKENGSTCSTCHDGSQVVFTIPMERNSDSDRNTISLGMSGTSPTYVGGSSCATATTAGIAALVWSVNPSMSKISVLTAMVVTSQNYPSMNSSRGYGNLDAQAAVNLAATY